jgi:TonB family protein
MFLAALVVAGIPSGPLHAEEESAAITRPRLIHFVAAEYPKDKHDAGITAHVVLSIEIGDDGKVGNVEVVEGAGDDFDRAAVAAARQFVFSPAESGGQPIPVKITYRYEFTIVTKMVAVGPQVNFDGVILDRFKKLPLAGVVVKIRDLDLATKTDEDGAFAFTDLAPGTYKVEIRHPRLVTVLTDETIRLGQKRTMKYFVEEKEEDVDEEVVVRAARIKKEAVETRIRTEEARKVPGTQGDTLKVVQNLPGVGRASFGSGQLVVWGSSPKETRVNVEGVEIPALYHMGGLRSTINSDLVKSIDLAPGAYGAENGRGLGGLVRVELSQVPTSGVHGYVASDILDTSGELSVAATPRLRFALAGRLSYLDRLMPLVTSADIGDSFPIPRYDDYQARAALALRKDEEVTATFLASDDHLRRAIPASDPADLRTENDASSFRRLIVSYSRLFGDGSSVRVTPSIGYDTNSVLQTFGSDTTDVQSHTWQYALRANVRRRVSSAAVLLVGVDAQGSNVDLSRHGPVNQPPREGDIVVFGQRPSSEMNLDTWKVGILSVGAFATLDVKLGQWTLTPGIRFEPTMVQGDHRLPFSSISAPVGYSRLDAPANPLGTSSGAQHAQSAAASCMAGVASTDTDERCRRLRTAPRSREYVACIRESDGYAVTGCSLDGRVFLQDSPHLDLGDRGLLQKALRSRFPKCQSVAPGCSGAHPRRHGPRARCAGALAARAVAGSIRLADLFLFTQRAHGPPRSGLPPVRSGPDPRVRPAGQLRPGQGLRGWRPLSLCDGHASHTRGGRLSQQRFRVLRAHVWRPQFHSYPGLLPA